MKNDTCMIPADRKVTVLGSTGSVGSQSMDVIRRHNIPVVGISGGRNVAALEEQIREFHPAYCAVADERAAADLKLRVKDTDTEIFAGTEGVCTVAQAGDSTMVLNSILGNAGLRPTLAAIEAGRDLALSNKETLVTAGEIVMAQAKRRGVRVLPVDSEHCAIYQCLNGENRARVKKLILTCSGGPFFGYTEKQLSAVTVDQTLAHPTWKMGAKITVDCATLMNKGLELIEAVRLFGVAPRQIEIVIHRESIIHSMVEYIDHAVLAQLSVPDMRLCVQYALTCPDRAPSPLAPLDLCSVGALTFQKPDEQTFSLLRLARQAVEIGGTATATLNGANEAAVQLFIQRKIGFLEIAQLVEQVVRGTTHIDSPDLEQIEAADSDARRRVYETVGTKVPGEE